MGIHCTSDLGDLLTTGIDDITNAMNVPVSFHSWLRSIGVVFDSCIEG